MSQTLIIMKEESLIEDETSRSTATLTQPVTKPSNEFSRKTDESAFESRQHLNVQTTTIYSVHPQTDNSSLTWITATVDGQLRHPLTFNHYPFNLPITLDLSKVRNSVLIHAVFHHLGSSFDKLLVVPTPTPRFTNYSYYNDGNYKNITNFKDCTLLALYDGGQLRGRSRSGSGWVKLSHGSAVAKFDDLIIFRNNAHALDRQGKLYLINNYKKPKNISIGKTLIDYPVVPGSGRFGWRKRVVIDGNQMYLVVRKEEKLFEVYKLMNRKKVVRWDKVSGFDGRTMLFMSRYYYFFWKSWYSSKFLAGKFENCIVFSEGAFPQYGNGCWEFPQFGRKRGEDDLAVFRLDDGSFDREGETKKFPKSCWSRLPWGSHVLFDLAAGAQSRSSSESEREPQKDDDSNSRDKNNGQPQSVSKDSNSKSWTIGQMQSDLIGQYEQTGMESDSDCQHQENEMMHCDTNSQEEEDVKDPRTLLQMNGVIGTSVKDITHLMPIASTPVTTKRQKSDSTTAKFEGFTVSSNLVPVLRRIWHKHGNIVENSTMRSADIMARALESLATMVQILEDNSALSLSGSQADYLSSTQCYLKCMGFKVFWLIPFVERAVQLHKTKPLRDSLNNLREVKSQVKERRAILFDELARLDQEEIKLNEEMENVSKMIPFSGQVNLDEFLGLGMT